MKKTPLIFAALVPLAATAGPADKNAQTKVDQEKLRGAVPVTAVLGEEVRSGEGQELGEIEDIVVSKDGKIEHVLIQLDNGSAQTGTAATDPRAGADMQTASQRDTAQSQPDEQRVGWGDDSELMQVEAKDVKFNADDSAVTLKGNGQPATRQAANQGGQSDQQLKASEIVGMEVNLSDEESFGDVEDVMIGGDGEEVVALVVDNWDGLDKKRRAFKMQDAQFNTEEGSIDLRLSSQEVEGMSEFNLDRYENKEWFNVDMQ